MQEGETGITPDYFSGKKGGRPEHPSYKNSNPIFFKVINCIFAGSRCAKITAMIAIITVFVLTQTVNFLTNYFKAHKYEDEPMARLFQLSQYV